MKHINDHVGRSVSAVNAAPVSLPQPQPNSQGGALSSKKFVYLHATPIADTADQAVVDLANSITSGSSFSTGSMVLPKRINLVLPANVILAEIISDNAYFFPDNTMRHTYETLLMIDNRTLIDTTSFNTVGIYSYYGNPVVIKGYYSL
jgi:hypothetical protein